MIFISFRKKHQQKSFLKLIDDSKSEQKEKADSLKKRTDFFDPTKQLGL